MAKIQDGVLRDWKDRETIWASEYKREREILRTAINGTDADFSHLRDLVNASDGRLPYLIDGGDFGDGDDFKTVLDGGGF